MWGTRQPRCLRCERVALRGEQAVFTPSPQSPNVTNPKTSQFHEPAGTSCCQPLRFLSFPRTWLRSYTCWFPVLGLAFQNNQGNALSLCFLLFDFVTKAAERSLQRELGESADWLPAHCVTLGKSLPLSGSQFPQGQY